MSDCRRTISKLAESGRFPHSLIICGAKGSGRAELARYAAALLLCDNAESGEPCGNCRSCELFASDASPDCVEAVHSGKRLGISVAEVRRLCSDAYIIPNNAKRKVYLFLDADGIEPPAQNALLKSLEEPPPYSYFIFTALSHNSFLPTVLSRSLYIYTSELTREETLAALVGQGFSPEKAAGAYSRVGGNLGKCVELLSDGTLVAASAHTAQLSTLLSERSEYAFMVELSKFSSDSAMLELVLTQLRLVLRDAAAISSSSDVLYGPCRTEAALLSSALTRRKLLRCCEVISETLYRLKMNVNPRILVISMCGQLFD